MLSPSKGQLGGAIGSFLTSIAVVIFGAAIAPANGVILPRRPRCSDQFAIARLNPDFGGFRTDCAGGDGIERLARAPFWKSRLSRRREVVRGW